MFHHVQKFHFKLFERYNGGFWHIGEQPGDSRADIDIKRSSRTPLCHFDKLEGQREQPGNSRADIDIKLSSRTPLCHFDKLEAQ